MNRPPDTTEKTALSTFAGGAKDRARLLGGSVAVLWAINLVDTILGHSLDGFGIHPRSLTGLAGIVFAPFLHASWAHLLANTLPLVVLGFIVTLRKTRLFFGVGVVSALCAGLGTWLVGGANTVHIGASSVVFGLFGYLVSRGFFERKLWPIVGSIAALVLYGGALRGLLPGLPGVSWEGHLFGFLGGILAARLGAPSGQPARAPSRIAVGPARRRIAGDTIGRGADEEIETEVEALRRKASR